jgi:hypothetical protein
VQKNPSEQSVQEESFEYLPDVHTSHFLSEVLVPSCEMVSPFAHVCHVVQVFSLVLLENVPIGQGEQVRSVVLVPW